MKNISYNFKNHFFLAGLCDLLKNEPGFIFPLIILLLFKASLKLIFLLHFQIFIFIPPYFCFFIPFFFHLIFLLFEQIIHQLVSFFLGAVIPAESVRAVMFFLDNEMAALAVNSYNPERKPSNFPALSIDHLDFLESIDLIFQPFDFV